MLFFHYLQSPWQDYKYHLNPLQLFLAMKVLLQFPSQETPCLYGPNLTSLPLCRLTTISYFFSLEYFTLNLF